MSYSECVPTPGRSTVAGENNGERSASSTGENPKPPRLNDRQPAALMTAFETCAPRSPRGATLTEDDGPASPPVPFRATPAGRASDGCKFAGRAR